MCVSEERGHREGAGAHTTFLTYTRRRVVSLAENAGRMPGVELREPRNLCVCVSKECGDGEGVCAHATIIDGLFIINRESESYNYVVYYESMK